MLRYIVSTCSENHITCSICGQAASDYPEVIKPLIESGVTSVSVTPDAISRTRELIFDLEKKHITKIKK
jgi:pyruvate,water dikinase